MKLLELIQQCIDEQRDMTITDEHNNLYKLIFIKHLKGFEDNVLMYKQYGIYVQVEMSYDILKDESYYEI